MGGQACVFYGAAEFSRDLDLLVLADPRSLSLLRTALDSMDAEAIAVPPLEAVFLRRGHAAHFRCRRQDVAGLRIDVMSTLRGVDDFERLWSRRTTILVDDTEVDLLAVEDLVRAKKTQQDKDWPMIRCLLEREYFALPSHPAVERIEFLLNELRTPSLLQSLAKQYPEAAGRIAPSRRAVDRALHGSEDEVSLAISTEESIERENDRAYWEPLRQELEHLRRSRTRPDS